MIRNLVFQFNQFTLDTAQYRLCLSGEPISVEPQVFDLLSYLIINRGRIVSRDELLGNLWKGKIVSDAALGVCLKDVRKAVGDSGDRQSIIKTVRGRGYQFIAKVTESRAEEPSYKKGQPVEREARKLPNKPSIAVLPFTNMSCDPEQEYFSDGITEDIITELCRFRSLDVIARNSTFSFKGQSVKPQKVAEELGASFVVEGSVRKVGARVRVTAQLINAKSGTHVWAERYDRELADIFEVQDEVSQSIVATVANRLDQSEAQLASRKRPDDLNAYDYFLRGLQQYNTRKEQALIEAKRLFSKGIEVDPDYARAHAYLALCIFMQIFYAYTGLEEVEIGLNAADNAYTLDNNEPLAHAALGLLAFTKRRDKEAIASLKEAVSLNPNDPELTQGLGFVLTYVGYPEEGCTNLMLARRLNPCADSTPLGISLYLSGRYQDATEFLEGKRRWGALYSAAANAQLGYLEEAQKAFQSFIGSMQVEARERGKPEPSPKNLLDIELADLRRESDRIHLLDGLRKAGLPE